MSKLILNWNRGNSCRRLIYSKVWNNKRDSLLLRDKGFKEFLLIQRYPSLIHRLGAVSMKPEVATATAFLSRLIVKLNSKLNSKQMNELRCHLNDILINRFTQHWYEDKPWKGQAYRCIRINQTNRKDPVLCQAACMAGIHYEELKLPLEFTIWIDPKEVCCRFGESRGSIFTVASFKGEKKPRRIDHSLQKPREEVVDASECKGVRSRNSLRHRDKPRFWGR